MIHGVPPTVDEIRAGATLDGASSDEDAEVFSMVDESSRTYEQIASEPLDNLLKAIGAIEQMINVVGITKAGFMLDELVDAVRDLKPDAIAIARISDKLNNGPFKDSCGQKFLEACELAPPLPKFSPLTMRALLTMPPKQWIINQVLGKGDLGMIYGAPGCGKTFVVIDMIFAACLGQQFAMRFGVDQPLNVAYCAGEGISGLPNRFAAAAEFYENEDIPNFTFFAVTPQLYTGEDVAFETNIRQFVSEWKGRQAEGQAEPLDMLVIDTLHSATAGADENSAKDMGLVLKLAKDAATELGCAVLLVHHTNKGGTAERGSSALRGAMDCMIEIRRISDTGTKAVMHCAKLKDDEAWKDQTLDLIESGDSVRVWWDLPSESGLTGKGAESKVKMLAFMQSQPNKKFTAKILGEVAGASQSQAIKVLAKMVSDGECVSELMDTTKPNSNRNPLTYKVLPI